jgi:hypothetical protein
MSETEDITLPNESEYVTLEKNSKSSDTKTSDKTGDKKTGSSVATYVFIGLFVVVLLVLLYYAYCTFIDNSTTEHVSKNKPNSRSDTSVSDFNLQDTINDLKAKQDNVLRRLSSDVGI